MRRLLSTCRRFLSDRRGNIAILFGIAAVPIFGMMGAALDYSMASMERTRLQAAADMTLLALSKMPQPMSQEQLETAGRPIFMANLGSSTPLQFQDSDIVIAPGASGKIELTVDTSYPLTLGGVISKVFGGSPYMNVGVHSQVEWGNTRLRVALVLDNTGSMADDGKMDALKTATKNFIQQMQDASKTDGDVYVSIIPFSKDVNVGPGNYGASWIDWTNWDMNNSCSISGKTTQSSCESATQTTGTCSNTKYTSQKKCENNGGRWNETTVHGVWKTDHTLWNGCVTDRGTNTNPSPNTGYDQTVDLPGGSVPGWPAEQFASCTLAVQSLTYDWNTLNTLVDDMTPVGNTNQPIGLVWGWQSLVGGGPFGTVPAEDSKYVYSYTIVLMSDGLNTQNRWTTTASSIDGRMYLSTTKSGNTTISGTCKNIKDRGIQIFSVQVNTGGDPTSTLLRNCATNPAMFFELKKASDLVATFEKIGSALANIHLSQ